MEKSDLQTGMRLIDKIGREWIVLKNVKNPYGSIEDMYVLKDGGWMPESSYNDDLTEKSNNNEYNIIKVYAQNRGKFINGNIFNTNIEDMDLIWEREDKKEMTIAEIEKELGYSIKIVKEK